MTIINKLSSHFSCFIDFEQFSYKIDLYYCWYHNDYALKYGPILYISENQWKCIKPMVNWFDLVNTHLLFDSMTYQSWVCCCLEFSKYFIISLTFISTLRRWLVVFCVIPSSIVNSWMYLSHSSLLNEAK